MGVSKITYPLLFAGFIFFIPFSSLLLRSGYEFLTTKSNYGKDYLFSLYYEFQRVVEQVDVNIRHSSLDKIQGLEYLTQERLLESVGLIEGMEIDPANYDRLFNYLSSYPWVESYRVEKSIFPSRIKIIIKEAVPKFVVEYNQNSWLMSDRGVLLESLETLSNPNLILLVSSLPRFIDEDSSLSNNEGTTLVSTSQRIKTALAVLEYFDLAGGLPFSYSSLSIMPYGELQFEVSDQTPAKLIQIVAHDIREAKVKKTQLEGIISDLKSRSETANVIDLRFSDQGVVR